MTLLEIVICLAVAAIITAFISISNKRAYERGFEEGVHNAMEITNMLLAENGIDLKVSVELVEEEEND